MDLLRSGLSATLPILVAMAVVAGLESFVPLAGRGRGPRSRLAGNLSLSVLTLVLNLGLNVSFLGLLTRTRFGILHQLELGPVASLVLALLGLDLATWLGHVGLHKVPLLWRVHCVHHSDPVVDVTTSLRQHPIETGIRYGVLAAAALLLGVGPAAFAIYRSVSAGVALLEHANLRVPPRVDDALSWVVTFPGMHKLHHSRDPRFTDTNYGNVVSWWDRLFATFTPARLSGGVRYGLEGGDDASLHSACRLLALPFGRARRRS